MKYLFGIGIFALMFLVSCSGSDMFSVAEDIPIGDVPSGTRSSTSTYSLSNIVTTVSLRFLRYKSR